MAWFQKGGPAGDADGADVGTLGGQHLEGLRGHERRMADAAGRVEVRVRLRS